MSTPSGTTFMLTPQVAEDAATLARLIVATCTVPGDSAGRKALTDTEFAQRLCVPVSTGLQLADWALVRVAPEETLTPYQYGMIDTAERVLGTFLASPAFHPLLASTIASMRGVFAAAALPADGWLTNPQHPARKVLTALYDAACGWQPENVGIADPARTEISRWLTLLARVPQPWQETVSAIGIWQAGERARTERVEKRLVDAEAGALRERRARQLAARTLNQALADRLISVDMTAALRQHWLPAMQWALMSDGEQGPVWQRIKRITGSLRWTLSPEIGSDARNQLIKLVGQISEDLATLAPAVIHDAGARESFLATLETEHLRILRNESRETMPFAPVETREAFADASASVSDTLLAHGRDLQPGQWILLHSASGTRRGRLVIKQEDTRQLLFASAMGARVLQASWEEFGLQVTRDDIAILPLVAPLNDAIAEVVSDLAYRHEQAKQSRLDTLRAAREQAAAEARVREEARQKALAEAQSMENARQEAQKRAAAADAGAPPRDAGQQNLQRARLQASSLTIGVWLEFREEGQEARRLKLAVLLPSSGKYIFVSADGTGKREILRDELVRRLADGSIAAVQKDQRLDDALTRVVDNLRNERGTP